MEIPFTGDMLMTWSLMKIIAGTQRKYRHALFHFSSEGNRSRNPFAGVGDVDEKDLKYRRNESPPRQNGASRLIPSLRKRSQVDPAFSLRNWGVMLKLKMAAQDGIN